MSTYLTQEGLDKLTKEVEHLKRVERPAITQQIAEARDKGDLSENAEYDAAKEAQGLLEETEADLKAKKISVESPIGKGLLGKKLGELAEIQVPNGTVKFEIVAIGRECQASLQRLLMAIFRPIKWPNQHLVMPS